ncbi:metal ABC transporter solute-binding protein, Zn/Mn family [Microbacterium sp. YY-01]|uniref:metal ABC transporter solute-binding protein, Zn/Mn family n=1 Tax=Microbacterium sp. YY-01 TaxID=3421634 RepID=UPI003D18527B
MNKLIGPIAALSLASFVLSGCAASGPDVVAHQGEAASSEGSQVDALQVVTTFSILEDIVNEVGAEYVDVHSIVPLGTDPHEYQPLPNDVKATAEADLIVWNGLNMELGDGWLESLLETTGHALVDDHVVEASLGVEPLYLSDLDGTDDEMNPHAFLDPNVGIIYTENIRDGLIQADPENADAYTNNADAYINELSAIDREYAAAIERIAPHHRTFVTSENAFQYMNERYGLTGLYIWAIDTGDLGSPSQIAHLVETLKQQPVPALFIESNVDTRPMQTVSQETGIPIFGEVFSDELGAADTEGASYLRMLRSNLRQIEQGLGGEHSDD